MLSYKHEIYGNLRVAWSDDLDGGGRGFGQQYIPVVRGLLGKVNRAYEFCSGPGFIGFSLLAHGLCETLCLSDVNLKAVDAARHTVALNGLQDRVSVYLSDCLDGIPVSERWDLVVSNPPHFEGRQGDPWTLRANDPEWNIHRRFYAGLARHLTPNGHCLIQENYRGSSEDVFMPLLDASGLEYAGSFMAREHVPQRLGSREHPPLNWLYFFWTRLKDSERVRIDPTAAEEVSLVCDESGWHVRSDDVPDAPLTLRVGEKYVLCFSKSTPHAAPVVVSWDSSGTGGFFPCTDGKRHRIPIIVTAPAQMRDALSKRLLLDFRHT